MIYDLALATLPVAITAFITWHIASKRLRVENVTQERTKWREKVRWTALCIHDAMIGRDKKRLNRLRSELRARLNPYYEDEHGIEDMEILKCVTLPPDGKELEHAEAFACRIALLLKHDWERAKYEAETFPSCDCKPPRVSYRDWYRDLPTRYKRSTTCPHQKSRFGY